MHAVATIRDRNGRNTTVGEQIRPGFTVSHKMYVSRTDAPYMSDLMPGAYLMGIYGDVMDEMFSRLDRDESMIASYSDVQFKAPVRVGDIIEVTGELIRIGTRSRDVDLTAMVLGHRVNNACPPEGTSGILSEPLLVGTARAINVIGVNH